MVFYPTCEGLLLYSIHPKTYRHSNTYTQVFFPTSILPSRHSFPNEIRSFPRLARQLARSHKSLNSRLSHHVVGVPGPRTWDIRVKTIRLFFFHFPFSSNETLYIYIRVLWVAQFTPTSDVSRLCPWYGFRQLVNTLNVDYLSTL